MATTDQQGFFQDAPVLGNQWDADAPLQSLLGRVLPEDVRREVTPSLQEMGELAVGELLDLSRQLDQRQNEPRLVPFDAWGRRVDEVVTHPAWERIGRIQAEHGVVATAYEHAHGEFSRLHQFALAYLFGPSSALYSCPLAMTDGAAKTLTVHGDRALVDRALPHLTSRDPDRAWTSGQWMTERTGGSDVGISETVARQADDGTWRLTGTKWFTSAVTADMALTLARPEGGADGGRGLAMFYVEVRDDEGRLNNLRVLRLKDKLGTRQMPTAELALEGTVAHLVGGPADGTKNITPMLAITRLWNAVIAASGMRRGLSLARDYAGRRVAFGRRLIDHRLHQATLADLRVQQEAAMHLAFRAVELLGREEAGVATEAEQRTLRMLLPLQKLVTGKQAVAAASETLEAFGGAGYIEDTGLPVLLRDAQVLPIWEGTTNVLSLDALRALQREDALTPFVEDLRRAATTTQDPDLAAIGKQAIDAAEHAAAWVGDGMTRPDGIEVVQHGARRWAMTLGRAMQAALLVQQAQHDLDGGNGDTASVAHRFAAEGLDLLRPVGAYAAHDESLARGIQA